MKRSLLLLIALPLLTTMPATADAPCGAVLCLSELSPEDAQQLTTLVADARTEFSIDFEDIALARAAVPELDAAKHGRLAIVGPSLMRLGGSAVPAILERLVLSDGGPEILTPSALVAWRIGLLDALGKHRDQRAAAVLEAVCRSSQIEPGLLTVAAAALGRLETDSAAAVLVELSRVPDARGQAVLAGMGHCRRLVVVQRLAKTLFEQRDAATHRSVARSLATAASGPVWRAGLVQHPEEGEEIRSIAAQALFDDFVVRSDNERETLVKALMVVDHSSIFTKIGKKRTNANPSLDAALDNLARRLETNPVSRMDTPDT